jgi:cytosine/adenosine deaminase-related metal-dependent hydrolase
MESPAEKAWLEEGEGPFREFFEKFLQQSRPLQTPEAFLEALERPALLTHAVQADDALLEKMAAAGHTVVHCPRSNRLLGCGRLRIEALMARDIPWLVATDGLSSNTSLNLWEEMRAALMLHHQGPLEPLGRTLLRSATSRAAEALHLPVGRIEPGRLADLITLSLPDTSEEGDSLPLQAILHTEGVESLYIQGKRYV